jgi:tetratricopeptide (TPR) repeat protein
MSDKKPVIFISYSHKDPVELEYVRSHLGPIASLGSVSVWDDNKLQIGDDWKGDINSAIDACTIFILLVSRHSLSSKFILEVELPRIFPRWQSKQVRFCPIVVTPCHMENYEWLDALNRRPKNDQALSELSDATRDGEMKAIVGEIARFVSAPAGYADDGGANAFRAPLLISSRQPVPEIVDYGHLPDTPYKTLVGRDVELTALDEAWIDKLTNIVSLVAWGGAGKTALLNEWLLQMRGDNYRSAAAVLGWSFYSQGTKERATSAEGFLDWALKQLGATVTSNSTTTKAEKLAEAMAQRRILLVLDGMEPLQHGPDGQEGYLKDQGMRTFLRRFATMPPASANGLIIITSRLEIRDIEALKGSTEHPGSHRNMVLHRLSDEAGAALLKDNAVVGSENERRSAAHEFDGHALALSLLASYLTELHGGDVRKRDRVRALLADSRNSGHRHAWRVMNSYEREWLHVNPLLSILAKAFGPKHFPGISDKLIMRLILSLIGLFDRPASAGCLDAVRRPPAIRGLTDILVSDDEWNRGVARLRKARLVDPEDPNSPGALDAHPLIREWFGDRLKETNKSAWEAANGRVYEHLRDTTEEGETPTLEDLAPLYQAIAHGCRAARYQEAHDQIYVDRICRLRPGYLEFYASKKLGAIASNLAAISWFFNKPYETLAATLNEVAGSSVMGEAAFYLNAQGRFAEALQTMQAALQASEVKEDWYNAAIRSCNLSEIQLIVGQVRIAAATAERSLIYAGRSGDEFAMMTARTCYANALHAAGPRGEAKKLFLDEERLQSESDPAHPVLYSRRGYQFCDLLLANGDYVEVRDRATKTLVIARSQNWLSDIAHDLLALGRAHLGLSLEQAACLGAKPDAGSPRSACDWLEKTIEGFSAAGVRNHIPSGLLARAAFLRSVGDWDGTSRDLDEVEEIAKPGPMKLYLCNMALERARLAFAKIEAFAPLNGLISDGPSKPVTPDAAEAARLKDEAAKQLVIVADFIKTCGYHRRDEELAELEAVLRGERKFADLPPRV